MALKPLVRPLVLLATATAAVVAGWKPITRQRLERIALTSRILNLDTEIRNERNRLKTLGQNTVMAEGQLERLQAPTAEIKPTPDPVREAEVAYWLARHARLKQLFVGNAAQSIPALRLLDDADWLTLARLHKFRDPTEIRRAMARTRWQANIKLLEAVREAVRALGRAETPSPPASIMALAPYLQDPSLADLLPELQLEAIAPATGKPAWRIQSKVPLDPDYEPVLFMSAQGEISASMPPSP